MKALRYCLFLMFCLCFCSCNQQGLIREDKSYSQTDSINNCLRVQFNKSYQSGLEKADSILELDPIEWKTTACIRAIVGSIIYGEMDKAGQYCEKFKYIAENSGIDSVKYLADYNALMSSYLNFTGRTNESIRAKENAIKYYQQTEKKERIPVLYNDLYGVYLQSSNYGKALESIEKAIFWSDSLGDINACIDAKLSLATFYLLLENSEKAEEILNSFDEIENWPPFKYPWNIYISYYDAKGLLYSNLNNQKQALFYYEKLLELPDSFFTEKVKSDIIYNVADVSMLLGNYGKSEKYIKTYEKLIPVVAEKYNYDIRDDYYILKGKLAHKLGQTKQSALFFDEAQKYDKNNQDIHDKQQIKKVYYQYYENIGDFRNAFILYKDYVELKDSLQSRSLKMKIINLELRYNRDTTLIRQQETIRRKEAEVKDLFYRRRVNLIYTILGLLLVSGGILWWRNEERKNLELRSLEHARDVAILRMENAKNRISPHFMFNVLNSIIKSEELTPEMDTSIRAFVNLLQSNLTNIDSMGVPLKQELKFVKDFVMLDNLRFEEETKYIEEIDKEINTNVLIPSMSIHILVENAIKHGLRSKKGDKKLILRAVKGPDKTIIEIDDNGIGRNSGQKTHGSGTGTKVLCQFIDILNQINQVNISLDYIDKTDMSGKSSGTIARLIIPDAINFILN